MRPITPPLTTGDRGPAVVNLQDGLRRLLARNIDLPGDPHELLAALALDTAAATYGEATTLLVTLHQQQHGLEATGKIDEPTALAMNNQIGDLGGFDEGGGGSAEIVEALKEQTQVLQGVGQFTGRLPNIEARIPGAATVDAIRQATDHLPPIAQGLATMAAAGTVLARGSRGATVTDLQTTLAQVGLTPPKEEVERSVFGAGTRDAVMQVQQKYGLTPNGIVDVGTRAALGIAVDVASGDSRIEGRVLLDNGTPAGGVRLRAVNRGFGGEEKEIGVVETDSEGFYALNYKPDGPIRNLEIQAVASGEELVRLSEPKADVGRSEVLNLVAPAAVAARAAEYTRLAQDLNARLTDVTNIGTAKEDGAFDDLATLHRETGWDARILAVAAQAAQLHTEAGDLPHEGLYALLRAGLPSDALMLAQVEADVVKSALTTARSNGVVSMTDEVIGQFTESFQAFADRTLLGRLVAGSPSTYGDLLATSGLDENARNTFARVYLHSSGTPDELWAKTKQAGLQDDQIARLQLHGKFAFVSGNSAPMTARLMATGLADPAGLVERDLYDPERWKDEARAAADNNEARLAALIPAAYAGDTVEKRLDAYAEDTARKVRLSYPTHVVGRLLERDGEDNAFGLGELGTPTASLLKTAADQGFRLGQTPVTRFFETHPGAKGQLDPEQFTAVIPEVKKLHRAYQVTPDNDSMQILLQLGLDSAHDIVAVDEATWLRLYGSKFRTWKHAEQVYRKAVQINEKTHTLFGVAATAGATPAMSGISPSAAVREQSRNELIKHFPTMESLFGSMDYCECTHCRSVLGPAAYLVDLLQYVDIEPAIWNGFLARWKTDHGNQDYGPKRLKPYDALIERRPDLAHLELSCENTSTELPYIDVVNEILEFSVAHGPLTAAAARGMDGARSEDVLAEPQHVLREAYDTVLGARYPLTLPFDLWLETVREFCASFDTPLARLLEVFRPGDDLFAPTAPYDREAIFRETLGLSPAQAAIFTDPKPLDGDAWYDLYGLYRTRAIMAAVNNTASTWIDVSDEDGAHFAAGDVCTYIDVSASTRYGRSNVVASVAAAGSGGDGRTRINFTDAWNPPPEAEDRLVIDAPAALRSAKFLARRLEVSNHELVALVQTGFVNPLLPGLGLLRTLGISISDALFARDHAAFYNENRDLLTAARDELDDAGKARYDSLALPNRDTRRTGWEDLQDMQSFEDRLARAAAEFSVPVLDLRTQVTALPFHKVLVLADPDAGCDFDLTTLQHADGTAAQPVTFLRINLFVRLWRSLGWPMDEVDTALQTLVPREAPYEPAHFAAQPLRTALICLAHLKSLDERLRGGPGARMRLLTFWSDMLSGGENSLYARLFLTPAMLRLDDVFNHPFRRYLDAGWVADQAANRLHRVELRDVASANRLDPAVLTGDAKLQLRYDELEQVQHLAYRGVLDDPAKLALLAKVPAGSSVLTELLDAVQAKAAEYRLAKGHLPALQGALGLTGDEIAAILSAPRPSLDTAALSIPVVTLLYRYAVLARALRLPVRDLIALQDLSGLDPFPALHPRPLAELDQDFAFSQTLRFVQVADEIRVSGLDIEDLCYLLRHQFDAVGKYRPTDHETLAALTVLADGIAAIWAEHALPSDPEALTDEVLRQKLGLILPADTADRFLALIAGTTQFTVSRTGVADAAKLASAALAGEPTVIEVTYDPVTQTQRLVLRGVLFDERKAKLTADFADRLTTAQKATWAALLGDVQTEAIRQANAFFVKHLEKQQLLDDTTTGFLDPGDFALLLNPDLPLDAGETYAARRSRQRGRLAESFLPFLQRRLVQRLILDTVTAAQADADPALVTALLTDHRLLSLPGTQGTRPLFEEFADAAVRGVTATFYASADQSGDPLSVSTLSEADLAGSLTPEGSNSARLEGYLEVPVEGAFRFYVPSEKAGTTAQLRFLHLPAPTLTGTAAVDGQQIGAAAAQYATLKPGTAHRFRLDLTNLQGGKARLLVQSETLPKDRLTQVTVRPLARLDAAVRAQLLLAKALQLLGTLELTERETRYLLTHPADFGNLTLALPTRTSDDTSQASAALFASFRRLARYAKLRRELAGGTADLIDAFEAASTGALDTVYEVLARLTRRDRSTVAETARALFAPPVLRDDETLLRLWEGLQAVERFGVPVATLRSWTRIVRTGAAPEERFAVARDLKDALRARFDAAQWRRTAQPVFDRLRARQRDALVRYAMHRLRYTTREQLYEHYLLDPGMEPVVRTSRIRLAIASVQLFVQRCLLNLEAKVPPAAILNANHWEWMKRYRVWEANRKVFLYPENYLEPEFRDDKTALFTELESSLMQGDVSADLAEDTFLAYLQKLDGLARLDIVAMHVESTDDPSRGIFHVIGRTHAVPHEYHYRRYVAGSWTPWEPIPVEIEGDHLAPIVWRDRLYLFWVTFAQKADLPTTSTTIDFKTSITVPASPPLKLEASLHWSACVNGEWSAPQSTRADSQGLQTLTAEGKAGDLLGLLVHVGKQPAENGQERGVYIYLDAPFNQAFYLAGRNSAVEVTKEGAAAPSNPFGAKTVTKNRYTTTGPLAVTYTERIPPGPGKPPQESPAILQSGNAYALLPTNNAIGNSQDEIAALTRPVFYADNQHTFFVEPRLVERTVHEWQEWVAPPAKPEPEWHEPTWWDVLPIDPLVPLAPRPQPPDPWIDVLSKQAVFGVDRKPDWLTGPKTRIQYGGVLIGPAGRIDPTTDTTGNVVGASGVDTAILHNLLSPDGTSVIARPDRNGSRP